MQNDPTTVGASDSDHPDLVDITLNDGKYTIRQVPSGRWECLRYGEPWSAFEGRQPDNLHTALAYEVDHLQDRVEGLNSDLDAAVEVAFRRGATDWVRLNYPTHFDRLSAADSSTALDAPFAVSILEANPGDKFVVRVDGPLTLAEAERIQSQVKAFVGHDTKVLVLCKGTEFSILRVADVAELDPSLESRESAHAGLAPAPGAEATAGTDAGGTAADDVTHRPEVSA